MGALAPTLQAVPTCPMELIARDRLQKRGHRYQTEARGLEPSTHLFHHIAHDAIDPDRAQHQRGPSILANFSPRRPLPLRPLDQQRIKS